MKNHSNPWMKKRVWKKRGSQTFNLFKYKNPPAPKARAKNFPKKVPPRGRDTERQADRYRGRGRERERKRETETETETESATATATGTATRAETETEAETEAGTETEAKKQRDSKSDRAKPERRS